MLRQLGVAEAAGGLAAAAAEQRQQQQQQAPRGPPRPRERRPALPAAALAARKSKRQRGERPLAVEEAVAEAAAELIGGDAPDLAGASEKDLGERACAWFACWLGSLLQAAHACGAGELAPCLRRTCTLTCLVILHSSESAAAARVCAVHASSLDAWSGGPPRGHQGSTI